MVVISPKKKMRIETILNGKKKRSLFDSPSDEFNRIKVEDKLITLASLNYWNLLDKTIKEYQEYYKEPNKKYIVDQLKSTLQFFVKHLEFENPKELEKLSLKKTIELLKTQLTEKIASQYSSKKLIESYLKNDEENFKTENMFFKIDFRKDLTEELKQRDFSENKPFHESYVHLYNFLENRLIIDYRKGSFQGCQIEMGTDYQTEYLIKHFLQKPNKESYFRAIEYAVNILYFEKEPYHKFFLYRVNFLENNINQDYFTNNKVGVRFNTQNDFEDWKRLGEKRQPKQQYVQRWKQLNENVKENDVIVIASYRNLGYKIGTISKGTEFEKVHNGEEFYLDFSLENGKEVDLDLFPFIQTLLPSNVTISPIKRKSIKLRKLYHNIIVQLLDNELDDIALEILVSEWLRTDYAPKECRLQYQFLKTGGNKKDIDVYGSTVNNEKLIAQISGTNDLKLIEKKIQKLEKYKGFKKLFFFNIPDQKTDNYEIIDLTRVISDLRNDKNYAGLINELE